METDEFQTVTILLLGDEGVGKSTFLSRLRLGPQADPDKNIPMLRDMDQPFVFNITPSNSKPPFRFEFFDNDAPDNYTLLEPDFVILCYDISNRESLESVRAHWRKRVILTFRKEDRIPVMVLGLKRDLRGKKGLKGQWVDPQEAYRYAQEMRCDLYAECSAVTGELMREVFDDIVRRAAKTTTPEGGQTPGPTCVVS